MSDKYNGWTNYETWLVNLWIDNSEGDQEYWNEQARECVQEAINSEENDIKQAARYALHERMKDSFEEQASELNGVTGLFADLMNAALASVNWYEIAEHYVDEIELFSAGWNMPGYMPDNPPAVFADFDAACEYIADELENFEFEEGEEEKETAYADAIETVHKQRGEFSIQVGEYVCFVSKL